MIVYIKYFDTIYNRDVDPSLSILSIIKKLNLIKNNDVNIMSYKHNGQELNSRKSLIENNIKCGAIIECLKKFVIYVSNNYTSDIQLLVDELTPISYLNNHIHDFIVVRMKKESFRHHFLKCSLIECNGKISYKNKVLDDNNYIGECNVIDLSTITYSFDLNIKIKNKNDVIYDIVINENDKMIMVRRIVANKYQIQDDNIVLTYEGKIITDYEKTVFECNIFNYSTIFFSVAKVLVL